MQILHIAGKIDPSLGGVGQAVRTMIKGLNELGLHNELATLDDPLASFVAEEKYILHTPGSGKGPWYYNAKFIPWLLENLSRFDVVIVHGLWQFHGYAVKKAMRLIKDRQPLATGEKRNLPKVYMMPHGMLDPYFQIATGRRIKALRNWSYWKLIEKNIISSADGILFTCLEEQRLARQPFSPYNPKYEAVVGLGVQEPPAFNENMRSAFLEKCPAIKNDSYLLFLSRIHEKKGVDLLIEAYKNLAGKLAAQHPGTGKNNIPKLVIAGPGLDTPYGEKIKQLVSLYPLLGSSVIFTGMLTGDAKWGAFYGCDAFVLPSHQENFGIALVEAMACRKPVLISNQVNIWQEVITAGGGIVADDTFEGTSYLLNSWEDLSDDEKPAMGLKARSCFEKKFAVDTAAREMLYAVSN
jgi:glycosyltransferase involved in cell wall biosynthesis